MPFDAAKALAQIPHEVCLSQALTIAAALTETRALLAQARAALQSIRDHPLDYFDDLKRPYSCDWCDNDGERAEDVEHWDKCPVLVASAALAATEEGVS